MPRSSKIASRAVLAVLAAVLATGCATAPLAQDPVAEPAPTYSKFRDLTQAEKKIIAAGVSRALKDPESAKFEFPKFPVTSENSVVYCGMLNGRNSYGGYVGFSPFITTVAQSNGKIVSAGNVATDSDSLGTSILAKMCHDKGVDPKGP